MSRESISTLWEVLSVPWEARWNFGLPIQVVFLLTPVDYFFSKKRANHTGSGGQTPKAMLLFVAVIKEASLGTRLLLPQSFAG